MDDGTLSATNAGPAPCASDPVETLHRDTAVIESSNTAGSGDHGRSTGIERSASESVLGAAKKGFESGLEMTHSLSMGALHGAGDGLASGVTVAGACLTQGTRSSYLTICASSVAQSIGCAGSA